MSCAIITCGGIGDVCQALSAATLFEAEHNRKADIYVNSHIEILDFIKKCTYFNVFQCPSRTNEYKDPENPLNLPKTFLDNLINEYDAVYSCWPDSLTLAWHAFPWKDYVRTYKAFMQTKVSLKANENFKHEAIKPNTKNIFIHVTSITMEKNYPLPKLQALVNLFNKVGYNIIIARTSQWKGSPLPFFCQGNYIDLVDRPLEETINILNKCDYFIGIDSAYAHISFHLQIPRIVLQQRYQTPYHIIRYHETCEDDMPLESPLESIFNRVMLNLTEPLTSAIPAYVQIPYQADMRNLLIKKDFT